MIYSFKQVMRPYLEPDKLRPYASISEQILMSGSNMVTSIVVVMASDVSSLGIYSFLFVLTTLGNGVFATLMHRQMMLSISSAEHTVQRDKFLATLALESISMLFGITLLVIALLLINNVFPLETYVSQIAASTAFLCMYNLFDLCKQYLYSTDNQAYSLRCTIIYVTVQMVSLLLIYFFCEPQAVVSTVYFSFVFSIIASLLTNQLCISKLSDATWHGWSYCRQLFSDYFAQGRYSLVGMLVTWIQSQSTNPFLMLISGPLIVGYFSLARMFIMPIAVVSQGLVNSTTPTLRRIFQSKGPVKLAQQANNYCKKNLLFAFIFIGVLLLADISGLLNRFVTDYDAVRWYLVLWMALQSATVFRFWAAQFFVVSMRFQLLLKINVVALCVTVAGLLFFGLYIGDIKLALPFVVIGECVSIFLLLRERKRIIQ